MHRPGEHETDGTPPAPDAWVLTRDAVRRLDRLAVERYGIPSIVLMENAAIGLRERAREMLEELGTRSVVILAGLGNNGGDGFALARHLHNLGCAVRLLTTGDPGACSGDAATNLAIAAAMGMTPERLDRSAGAETLEKAVLEPVLLVDAILGTGVRESARGAARDAILQLNRLRAPTARVLAVDLPSGLDCDTGEPAGRGEAVEADATVTFAALKPGFLRLGAQRWTGEVSVAGIGAPESLVRELGERIEDARRGLPSERNASPPPEEPPRTHARRAGG